MIIDNFYTKEKAFLSKMEHEDMWEWSRNPHTAEEIMLAEIIRSKHKSDSPNVCASYYCMATPLSETDVDNLLFINSGLFTYEGWDEEVVEFVIELLMRGDRSNVYKDLKEVVKKKRFNVFFRKKCKDLCDAAVDTKISTVNKRKDEIIRNTRHVLERVQDMGEKIKNGHEINKVNRGASAFIKIVDDEVRKLISEVENFENCTVWLNERLDWKALMSSSLLSEEYLERRRALWENVENTHR